MAEIEWRVTRAVKERLDRLYMDLHDTVEFSEEWHAISDEIRSLPGCPYGTNEESDTIVVVCIEEPRVGYTGPIALGAD